MIATTNRGLLRYEQVMDLIDRYLADKGLQPGDRLPTNKELADLADVSLISVRRALDELERAGRVRRHQGVGTFVSAERILASPALAGGLLATLTGGRAAPQVETRILEVSAGLPTRDTAAALALHVDHEVWCIKRLRVIADRPMISESSYIPVHLAPGLGDDIREPGISLYRILADRYGLADAYEEQHLEIVKSTPSDRRMLDLTSRDQVVRIRGVSFSVDGRPFDCFEQCYPSDGFTFYLSGSTDRRVLPMTTTSAWGLQHSVPRQPDGED